jgi:hypothetical protein
MEINPSHKRNPLPGDNPASRWKKLLSRIRRGLTEKEIISSTHRLKTHLLAIFVILSVAVGMREFYVRSPDAIQTRSSVKAAVPTSTPVPEEPVLPFFKESKHIDGVVRRVKLHTDVPSRPRMEIQKYTIKEGDTLIGIAEKFGLEPETILWSNQYTLGDNPHNVILGQELNILPVDGAYHRWSAGDGLNGVAGFFSVTAEEIIEFPGNNLSYETIGDWSNPNIEPGSWLVIPGGEREFVSWSAPIIPLDDPGVAKVLGPGACEVVAAGAVGAEVFVWPVNNHYISGYDFNPRANHSGIDLDGDEGDPVYAVDNGVVVYAGWNQWGYGNTVVINHSNGWQTLYAHLSAINVSCGQSVWQTNVIGAVGNTGNSAGAHLHFEMMYNGIKVDPKDYLR